MEKELIKFIELYNLSPFDSQRSSIKQNDSIFKTRDSKSIHTKVISKISSNFVFPQTSNLLNFFQFTNNEEEINQRQQFFSKIKSLNKIDKSFLKRIKTPKPWWKPKYDVVVVTENTETFSKLKEMNCPTQLIISENDVSLLESRDLIQVIDCDEFGIYVEELPQSVAIKNLDQAYLERHLEKLSGWKNNLEILNQNTLSEKLKSIIQNLSNKLDLTSEKNSEILSKETVEEKIDKINEEINSKLKELTISGESLIAMMSKGILPDNLKETVKESIKNSKLPENILEIGIPVKLDEEELDKLIKKQSANEYFDLATEIKSNSEILKEIPKELEELSKELILFDFITGIRNYLEDEMSFPQIIADFKIENSRNIFLDRPHPVSFHLNEEYRCSILTGANSGGKTTLIEHIIQIISLSQIGLPISGDVKIPLFTDVYYFAKNKGSMSKGAFETLLDQMSKIAPGDKTLILADEIEAVTEPGVAGNIIAATVEYFLNKDCFLVIATHLGHEIQKVLPNKSRIDGIEAKGLDENFELIVDHNPVLGRLAHSTPELIVEKLANSQKKDYFIHLNNYIKNKNKEVTLTSS